MHDGLSDMEIRILSTLYFSDPQSVPVVTRRVWTLYLAVWKKEELSDIPKKLVQKCLKRLMEFGYASCPPETSTYVITSNGIARLQQEDAQRVIQGRPA